MQLKEHKETIKGRPYKFLDSGGKNPVFIMLHGIGANKSFMENLIDFLSDDYRCVALDLPGHNKLSINKISKFEDFVLYISNFLKSKKITEFNLLGYSLGGLICLKIAEESRFKINKLVIWSSPVAGFEKGLRNVARVAVPLTKRVPPDLFLALVKSNTVSKLIDKSFEIAGIEGTIPKKTLQNFRIENAAKIIGMTDKVSFKLPLNIPSMFVFDKHDPVVSLRNYSFVKETTLPEWVQTCLVDRSGHFKSKSGFNEFKKELRKFLTN